MNNKYLCGIVLFILFPIAYYFAYASYIIVRSGGKSFNYLILFVSSLFIIISNILLLNKISKK